MEKVARENSPVLLNMFAKNLCHVYRYIVACVRVPKTVSVILSTYYVFGEIVNEETLQKRDKAIHEATALLKRANDILGCFIETKIPELVIKLDKEDTHQVC